jgi:hypothetical protein
MDLLESQQHINNLKVAQRSYRAHASYYNEIASMFTDLIEKLENGLKIDKTYLKYNTQTLSSKLKNQNLENRKNFINLNQFNEYDVQNLSSLLSSQIANNVPTLELFPGSGQFLPYAVASEPLFVADRFMDICIDASASLNNEFYASRRLRKYEISDNNMISLPQERFGLVYCFNEFFSADEEYIINISKQIFDLLYNGGKWIFNFLPDDQIWAQQATMKGDLSSIDYNFVIENLILIGFELITYEIKPLKSSFMIFKKSGDPEPRLKIGGGVAEIIDI